MHDCPNCGRPCFCDGDDTDLEDYLLDGTCQHDCEEGEKWVDVDDFDCPRCGSECWNCDCMKGNEHE
jgi:hypothetical protein